MKTKRKTWYLQKKDILYVEENHDGKYGAKGKERLPKRKLTPEDVQRVNAWNKSKRANGWIPVKYHQISEKERAEEFLSKDIQYMLDCKMPDDGQEILVTNGETTWQDTCFIDSNGYYLDGGYDWIDIMAWMPLPKPYKEG